MTPNTAVGGLKPEELRAAVKIIALFGKEADFRISHNGCWMIKDSENWVVLERPYGARKNIVRYCGTDPNDALDALGID